MNTCSVCRFSFTNHPHNLFRNTPGFKQEQEAKQVKNYNRGRGFE